MTTITSNSTNSPSLVGFSTPYQVKGHNHNPPLFIPKKKTYRIITQQLTSWERFVQLAKIIAMIILFPLFIFPFFIFAFIRQNVIIGGHEFISGKRKIKVLLKVNPPSSFPIPVPNNGKKREVEKEPLTSENFSQHAQLILNKFYKKPLPEVDKVRVPNLQGKMVFWKDLSLPEQTAIIQANKKGSNTSLFSNYSGPKYCEALIPRWLHGCMHVCRAAVEILLLHELYKKYDPSFKLTKQEILLAQYLILFHDSAREAEGVDVWDSLSAEEVRLHLKKMGFSEDKINQAVAVLKSKDNPLLTTRDSMGHLIRDSDCTDILRVYKKKNFHNRYLDIFNLLKNQPGFKNDLEKLKDELEKFIQLTEQPLLKAHLETQSENYYEEVLGLVNLKKGGKPLFPFLCDLLNKQIDPLPRASLVVRCIADSDFAPIPGELVVVKNLVKLGIAGAHASFMVASEKGEVFFWKEGDRIATSVESAASAIANHLTGGLVPIAQQKLFQPPGKPKMLLGTLQPYIKMNKGPFAPKHHIKYNPFHLQFDPTKLTPTQREQLLAHAVADRVIANYDTHTKQFGIDQQGNVIGFDKAQAYKGFGKKAGNYPYFNGKIEPQVYDPNFFWLPVGLDRPTYPNFAAYLINTPQEAQRIWNSPIVRATFKRCQALEKIHIRYWLMDYAKLCFTNKEEEFLDLVYQRAQEIESQLKTYFKIS